MIWLGCNHKPDLGNLPCRQYQGERELARRELHFVASLAIGRKRLKLKP
jgi:hypothetical protein